jgi:hypothetical protein
MGKARLAYPIPRESSPPFVNSCLYDLPYIECLVVRIVFLVRLYLLKSWLAEASRKSSENTNVFD